MRRLVLEETCEHETFDLDHYADCEWFSPQRTILQPAEILAAAANLDGAKRVKLPDSVYDLDSAGGEWSDYLVIPLPDKETP